MINPNDLSGLIYKVLKAMDVKEKSKMEVLIKGTFLHRSGLTKLFDYGDRFNPEHGMMLLSTSQLKELYDKIRLNMGIRKQVNNALGIDVGAMDVNSFVEELDYNIGFMIAVTYCFYSLAHEDFPENNLTAIAGFYRRNMLHSDDMSVEREFVDAYQQVFVS